MTTTSKLSAAEARRALNLRDLTDPGQGPHAMQALVSAVESILGERAGVPVRRVRANPVVTVGDNYERLGYAPDAAARDARYSRYLTDDLMLRSHTSAMIPAALESLATGERPEDVALTCPGIVYRRDVIDRRHVGEPHQLDVWRVRARGEPLTEGDLDELVAVIVGATIPGRRWRTTPAVHPYTLAGRQVDVDDGGAWVEIGECGLAHPAVLARCGLPDTATGLASGWGLDRLLMLRKGIDDIRLLRAGDPRVAEQMLDLDPYEPVSSMPPAPRDLSIAVDGVVDAELLGDRVRAALGPDADVVESVEVMAVTPGSDLPDAARARLGMRPEQQNVLLRVVLRAVDRTLTADEANRLRDRIYAALHRGTVNQWASGEPEGAPR